MFAGREGLGREGWSGRKGEQGGRKGGEGGRRGAVGVWGMRGEGGRRREEKEAEKENNQIMKKNKLIMLDVTGYNDVN